ncbi:tRNA (adenosine(37)-N6)-threonylcarbamoyltransferase complex dimerization subunit type 1 TsaB [Candidatus Saccharibacteria bacterium]|nr:tRNA (adenosine(37)-N6)-threonylcarbamoyltransferase complex dimerization subunit type 1 TsaB [Candidatus Saccharibacteria bacterium]MCB9820962.1 tRNA (adenosine(37)-N6)-threonylcarbamoyltransferase complex dimerization subunit type 1 TsaB [Candidatus Nomurabacteria bacterium]
MKNILLIRTDKPESELYLNDQSVIWRAHRELSDTILLKIKELLDAQGLSYTSIEGIGVFEGPGSFTGLRIGITVANTLAYGLNVPIVGEQGDAWQTLAVAKLEAGQDQKIVKPFYGREARITQPRK